MYTKASSTVLALDRFSLFKSVSSTFIRRLSLLKTIKNVLKRSKEFVWIQEEFDKTL
jgi:hypothetical protein